MNANNVVLPAVADDWWWAWTAAAAAAAATLLRVFMAGEVTGEVLEWREDLEETEEVSLRGRALPGSLSAISFRTAWGLSAPV